MGISLIIFLKCLDFQARSPLRSASKSGFRRMSRSWGLLWVRISLIIFCASPWIIILCYTTSFSFFLSINTVGNLRVSSSVPSSRSIVPRNISHRHPIPNTYLYRITPKTNTSQMKNVCENHTQRIRSGMLFAHDPLPEPSCNFICKTAYYPRSCR